MFRVLENYFMQEYLIMKAIETSINKQQVRVNKQHQYVNHFNNWVDKFALSILTGLAIQFFGLSFKRYLSG
jgi:hypothetical protein